MIGLQRSCENWRSLGDRYVINMRRLNPTSVLSDNIQEATAGFSQDWWKKIVHDCCERNGVISISEDDCHQAAYFSYFLRSSNTYRLTVARKGHLLVGIFFLSIYFYWMLTCNSKSRYLCLEISTYDSRPWLITRNYLSYLLRSFVY